MDPNPIAIQFIKHFEGCRLSAYPDPISHGAPWTIGYGQTKGIKPGMTWTQEQADNDLNNSIIELERQIRTIYPAPLNSYQIGALIDFAYNVGMGNLTRILSDARGIRNNSSIQFIADKLVLYSHSGKKFVQGLLNRRIAEKYSFLESKIPF